MKTNKKDFRDYLTMLQPVIFVAMMIMAVRGIEYIGKTRTTKEQNKNHTIPTATCADTARLHDIRDVMAPNSSKTR